MYRGQPKTVYFWITAILPPLALLLTAAWVWLRWDTLAEAIPIHYTGGGVPDDWGPRTYLWALLGVGLLMYALMLIASFFPQTWRIRGETAKANPALTYRAMGGMLGDFRLAITALFCFMTVWGAAGASGPAWIEAAVTYVLIFVPLVRYLLRLYVFRR